MNKELDRPKRKRGKKISRFIRLHLEIWAYAEKMLPGERQVEKIEKKK